MKRVMLVIAYDGTHYCGWQVQPNGITVEEVLNRELSLLLKEDIQVIGASRTDSGVHALGNLAVFDTETRIPADKICFALNQRLPEDIRIQGSEEVPLGFHPRRWNSRKTYEYRILNRKFDIPSFRLNSYFVYLPLDVEAMRIAADYLVGEHDFVSFCSARTQAEDTYRRIYDLVIEKVGDMITIRISGNGFLYNMVRIIVGTLLKVGLKVYPPYHVKEILEARNRQAAGPKVPAKGLTLVSIELEKELPEIWEVKNKKFYYRVLQQEIREKKTAYIQVEYSTEEEYLPLVERNTRQALRNGARTVYLVRFNRVDEADRVDRINESETFTINAAKEGNIKEIETKIGREIEAEKGKRFEVGEFLFQPCEVEQDGMVYSYVCYIEDYGSKI